MALKVATNSRSMTSSSCALTSWSDATACSRVHGLGGQEIVARLDLVVLGQRIEVDRPSRASWAQVAHVTVEAVEQLGHDGQLRDHLD